MNPEPWERVRALFHSALGRPPSERTRYLRAQTDVDAEIRGEVESLLAAHTEAEGFLSAPPADGQNSDEPPRPILTPGSRVGHFEILTRIGAGGMGEVYQARDMRLDRAVAIKVLAPDRAGDPHGHERFEREARLISMLSHPHICTLYDVGSVSVEGGEMPYLVMELLSGETLASRLRRGPLSVDRALTVAAEIIDALAAAHAHGIVHRDLKPANIVLTDSGVKLLDFGLARLRASGTGRRADSVTADEPLTLKGSFVGTLPYMAPEQVRGEEADARSDLFAFGAVLYEMLTGSRAFAADSQAELVAAILERQPPPLAERQPLAPAALDRLVTACLAKDPRARWQHSHDVALELRGITEGGSGGIARSGRDVDATTVPAAGRSWRVHGAWTIALLVVGLAVWSFRPAATTTDAPPNPSPVIVMMDSPLEGRVYDARTLAAGGTNADDITDILRPLKLVTYKENTSPMWHREEQVRQANPDLIISHLSCLYDVRVAKGDRELSQYLFNLSENRLTQFFGYLGALNSRTRFLVYSRGRYVSKEAEAKWAADVVTRFPQLEGRLFAMMIPGGESATFRDAQTGELVRARVKEILQLP
jgi:hypothetical protein